MFQEMESLITYSSTLFSLQPKLLAKELLDLVASHFNLKEKEFSKYSDLENPMDGGAW